MTCLGGAGVRLLVSADPHRPGPETGSLTSSEVLREGAGQAEGPYWCTNVLASLIVITERGRGHRGKGMVRKKQGQGSKDKGKRGERDRRWVEFPRWRAS